MKGPWYVTDSEGIEPGETPPVLEVFETAGDANAYVGNLPDYKSGRYYVHGTEWGRYLG